MRLRLLAPAKLNLALHVLGKRPDGYHELVTLMQPVSVFDELEIVLGEQGLSLRCSDPQLQGEDNLVLRAAKAFYRASGLRPSASFVLTKHIPVAAGLGGGSSDAAATLKGLNALHGEPLSPAQLAELAAGLGADVPFFLCGTTALCTGTGTQLQPLPGFPRLHYVLVNPGIQIPTAWVYKQFDSLWTSTSPRSRINRPQGLGQIELLHNDLEQVSVAAWPEIGEIKKALVEAGAIGALMSGSGPTVFGVFVSRADAARAKQRLQAAGRWWVRCCEGLKKAAW